jgi:hypothetical protein
MTAFLVTRYKADARLLVRLLGPELQDRIGVFALRNWSDCVSGSRTLLFEGNPVALVLDAESRKRPKIDEHRQFLHFALGLANRRALWKVILVKPEIPRLYFRDLGVLRQLVRQEPTEEQLARARSKPRLVLAELLGVPVGRVDTMLRWRLRHVDVSPLAQFRSIQRLRAFLEAHAPPRAPGPDPR